jgi:arylsulfatase A
MKSLRTPLSITLLAFCGIAFAQAAPKHPNLIFILSDDIAQGDIGAYGQKLIQTPNLDRLCSQGTRYLSAYCGTSVCAPSRTSFFTGLHMGHSPVRANREVKPEGQRPLPADIVNVGKLMKSAGYATATMGKWGMGMLDTTGSPLKNGIDRFYGYNCQRHAHSFFPTYLYDNDKRIEIPENQGGKKAVYAQELIQKEVLRWVDTQGENPFFLFYAITVPTAALRSMISANTRTSRGRIWKRPTRRW